MLAPSPPLGSTPGPARTRVLVATAAGVIFVLAYVATAVTLPDLLPPQHWAVQALYWCVAGVLWVFPVLRLIVFASGRTRPPSGHRARA